MSNQTVLTEARQAACLLPSLTEDTADELRESLRSADVLNIELPQILIGLFRLYSMPSYWDDLDAQSKDDLWELGNGISTIRLMFLVASMPLVKAFIQLQA